MYISPCKTLALYWCYSAGLICQNKNEELDILGIEKEYNILSKRLFMSLNKAFINVFVIISYVSNKCDWIIVELQYSQPLSTAVNHAQEI